MQIAVLGVALLALGLVMLLVTGPHTPGWVVFIVGGVLTVVGCAHDDWTGP